MWTSLQLQVLLAGLCVSVQAASLIQPEWGYYFDQDDQGPGTYTYGYDVEDPVTRNIQFRRERRLPNGTVTGSYGLVEPDGNVKVVHYISDNLGYRATIENSQRPNEEHPPPTVRTWAGQRPAWSSIWYRDQPAWDTLWYRQQSPLLSHALASLQTLDSPVHEEHTPPAQRGPHGLQSQHHDEPIVQEHEKPQGSSLEYVFRDNSGYVYEVDAPQGDNLRNAFREDAPREDKEYVYRMDAPREDNSRHIFGSDEPQAENLDGVSGGDVHEGDNYLTDSAAADQSQNYPIYELPPSQSSHV